MTKSSRTIIILVSVNYVVQNDWCSWSFERAQPSATVLTKISERCGLGCTVAAVALWPMGYASWTTGWTGCTLCDTLGVLAAATDCWNSHQLQKVDQKSLLWTNTRKITHKNNLIKAQTYHFITVRATRTVVWGAVVVGTEATVVEVPSGLTSNQQWQRWTVVDVAYAALVYI